MSEKIEAPELFSSLLSPDVCLAEAATSLPARHAATPAVNVALKPIHTTDRLPDVVEFREPLVHEGQRPADQGGSTIPLHGVGYRSGVLNETQWQLIQKERAQHMHSLLQQSLRLRDECRVSEDNTHTLTAQQQQGVTCALDDRVRDTINAREELSDAITRCREEFQALTDCAGAVQRCLERFMSAERVTEQCVNTRLLRRGEDRTADSTAHALNQELRVEQTAEQLAQKLLKQARTQLDRLKELKRQMELEWSNKLEAFQLDHGAAKLVLEKLQAQFKSCAGRQSGSSEPLQWRARVDQLLTLWREESAASARIRSAAQQAMCESAADLQKSNDAVSLALARRIEELQTANDSLVSQANNVLHEAEQQYRSIATLQEQLRQKESPMQVAQTRAWLRSLRPGLDRCVDVPHTKLEEELETLPQSVHELREHLRCSEQTLSKLHSAHTELILAITAKQHTLALERRVVNIRLGMPTRIHLVDALTLTQL